MTIAEVLEVFNDLFGSEGDIGTFFAPARLSLIGQHTDYNGGHCFPCAITLGIYGAIRLREDHKIRMFSINFDDQGIVEDTIYDLKPLVRENWGSYIKAMIWVFRENGHPIDCGFDLVVGGDIPFGAALASSAALESLGGVMLRDMYNLEDVTNVDIAKMGQIAESDYIGYYSSIMDHFACMMGIEDRAIYFDAKTMHYEYPPFKLGDAKLVIVYSQIEHVPDRNMHAARREECARALRRLKQNVHINYLCDLSIDRFETFKDILMDDLLVKRTRHVVYENQRTIQAVSALRAHNIEKFGQYMYASHLSLRDNYEVTCEEIDYLVDTAMSIDGVIGSRMIGSGLGGSTVNIVKESAIPSFMEIISREYKKKTGLSVDFYGAWPAEGARAILP